MSEGIVDDARRPTVKQRAIPAHRFALLNARDDWRAAGDALAADLARDGYLVLRGALDAGAVRGARAEVFARLAEVGEVATPSEDGIATGGSQRAARHRDLGAFWRSVCEGAALRAVSHGPALAAITASLLRTETRPLDFLWLRTMLGGRSSPLHYDHVYMNRGSSRVLTAWIPLGDVPLEAGPILVVEGSHRFADLIARYRGRDVDRDGLPGSFPDDALAFAEARDCRLLSADFRAGDVVLFGMFTLHGSCDNRMAEGRVRLSCDVRWQPSEDPEDDRWFGSPPTGHGGRGYGGMNGARPLGEEYSAR
jgi:ectoine hydroxylase-related dioxygenase (phytanoyl-CoA dioxygenase family)